MGRGVAAISVRLRIGFVALGCLAAAVEPAAGQSGPSGQYIPPGQLGLPRPVDREEVERAVDEARWRLGPLRLEPWLRIHDVSYTDNVFGSVEEEAVSDTTATAGAGLKGYLRLGRRGVLALHALPEYVWWRETTELRQWRGRYGAGLFGDFNRLRVEVQGRQSDSEGYLTPELETRGGQELRRGAIDLELDLPGPFSLFARGSTDRFRHDREVRAAGPGAFDPTALDRDEERVVGGVRYELREGLSIGAGVERTRTDFVGAEGDRSNSGGGPLVEVALRGNSLQLSLSAVKRSLDAREGASFREFEEVSGDFRLAISPGGRLGGAVYGARSLVYSALAGDTILLDDRLGLSLESELGWRTRADAFVERGRYDFRSVAGDLGQDDSLSVGGGVRFAVRRDLALDLGVVRTDYDSVLPERDRTVTVFRTGLTFGLGGGATW